MAPNLNHARLPLCVCTSPPQLCTSKLCTSWRVSADSREYMVAATFSVCVFACCRSRLKTVRLHVSILCSGYWINISDLHQLVPSTARSRNLKANMSKARVDSC